MWRPRSRRLGAVAAALLLVISACSSDDDDSSNATTEAASDDAGDDSGDDADGGESDTDDSGDDDGDGGSGGGGACDLLTADDFAAAGLTLDGELSANDLATSDECVFMVTADSGATSGAVVLYTPNEAQALGPELYPGSEELSGIGAAAWYVPDLGLAQVRLADDRVVSVQIVSADPALSSALQTLAERAATAA